jgi:hypothetical protein
MGVSFVEKADDRRFYKVFIMWRRCEHDIASKRAYLGQDSTRNLGSFLFPVGLICLFAECGVHTVRNLCILPRREYVFVVCSLDQCENGRCPLSSVRKGR